MAAESQLADTRDTPSLGQKIVWAGFLAGSVDVAAAALIYRRSPVVILDTIAGGLLGPNSLQGGESATVLGLGLQWAMSIAIAGCYVGVTAFLPALRRNWRAGGLIAGVVIFAVMNYIVVPLSALHRLPRFAPALWVENLLAILLFGLIVAYCVRPQPAASAP